MTEISVMTIKKEKKCLKRLGFNNSQIKEILYYRYEDNGSYNALNVLKTLDGHIQIINAKTTRNII